MKFQIYQCNNCGNIHASTSKKTFKCFNCAKSIKILIKNKSGSNLKILFSTNDSSEAPFMVRELKRLKYEGKFFV